jgi:hypothetical protein
VRLVSWPQPIFAHRSDQAFSISGGQNRAAPYRAPALVQAILPTLQQAARLGRNSGAQARQANSANTARHPAQFAGRSRRYCVYRRLIAAVTCATCRRALRRGAARAGQGCAKGAPSAHAQRMTSSLRAVRTRACVEGGPRGHGSPGEPFSRRLKRLARPTNGRRQGRGRSEPPVSLRDHHVSCELGGPISIFGSGDTSVTPRTDRALPTAFSVDLPVITPI